jgi:hypothetical protein
LIDGMNTGNEIGWNRIYGHRGSALDLSQSDAWIHDNLIWDNAGAGIETQIGTARALLVHNTVAYNGVGFFGDAAVWNCIFAGNEFDLFAGSASAVAGCLIENDWLGFTGANGNFSADPELVCIPPAPGSVRDPLHISNRSPCIDRSRSGAPRVATTDIDGEVRVPGITADVGADEVGHTLDAIPPFVSTTAGGTNVLSLRAPASRAGHLVLVMGSITGTGPFPIGSTLVPLAPDFFFVMLIELAATPILPGFVGFLDAAGSHTAYFPVPPGAIPAFTAGTFEFTFAWLDLTTLDFASNATCIEVIL